MKLQKKEIQIIKLLLSANSFMSSYAIAESIGINRRLVRDEMNAIRIILKSLGYQLLSKASKGYMIEPIMPNTLQQLAKKMEQFEQEHYSSIPTLPSEREDYIIRRLLNTNDYVKIDDLANELLMSRSSVSNDLKSVRKILKKSELTIKQKPNYGLKVVGKEIDCRKPLVDIFFTNFKDSAMFYDLLRYANQENEMIENVILQILEAYQIEISDVSLCDFLLCVSTNITRMRLGSYLEEVDDISDIENRIEFVIARKIADTLQERLSMQFPYEEITQIGIELLSKRSSFKMAPYQEEKAKELADATIQAIYDNTRIDFTSHVDLYEELIRYNQGTLLRQRFKTKLRNPLYKEIKQKYALGYELAKIASTVFEKQNGIALSLSELSYFAIMFNTALNRGVQMKKKVLLLCSLSYGTTELIEWQINERFGNEIEIIKHTQFYKLHLENLNLYDFIISTIPIHDPLSIPCLFINTIMEEEDFNKIDNYLAYAFYNRGIETCFHPRLFNGLAKVKKRSDIINEMYKLLKQQFSLKDASLKRILQTYANTNLYEYDNYISIIKYNKAINNNNVVTVVINHQPIAGYKKESQIFVLVAFKERDEHLANALCNSIAALSQNQESIFAILENPTYNNFIRILQLHK